MTIKSNLSPNPYALSEFSWNETNTMINQKLEGDIVLNVAIVMASLFIIFVNASIMSWLVNKTRTLVDKLILVDCAANIGGLVSFLINYGQFSSAVPFCVFKQIFGFIFKILNRVIPITIATYRYLLVCQNQKTERFGKAKLGKILFSATILVPILVTAIIVVYRENILFFTICIGREEIFILHEQEQDIDHSQRTEGWSTGRFINQPIYNPVRLLLILLAITYFLMTPMVYCAIYRFRRNHDRTCLL